MLIILGSKYINMHKRKKKTNLTKGKKHMRMRRSQPVLIVQICCNAYNAYYYSHLPELIRSNNLTKFLICASAYINYVIACHKIPYNRNESQ